MHYLALGPMEKRDAVEVPDDAYLLRGKLTGFPRMMVQSVLNSRMS